VLAVLEDASRCDRARCRPTEARDAPPPFRTTTTTDHHKVLQTPVAKRVQQKRQKGTKKGQQGTFENKDIIMLAVLLLATSTGVAARCSAERMEQTALAFKTTVELGQGWANTSVYVTSTHAPFSAQVGALQPHPVTFSRRHGLVPDLSVQYVARAHYTPCPCACPKSPMACNVRLTTHTRLAGG
jgi:hypothetical protein